MLVELAMDDKKWKLIGKKNVFESKWLSIEDRSYELPDGKRIDGYYHLNRPDYVLILALDKEGRLVVEKQYRRGVDDFVYELPAGWVNNGETVVEAAKRELKEETGCLAEGNEVYELYPQPGFSSMKAYVVILKVGELTCANRESDEDLTYEFFEIETVKQMVRDNKIKDMGFLAALNYI